MTVQWTVRAATGSPAGEVAAEQADGGIVNPPPLRGVYLIHGGILKSPDSRSHPRNKEYLRGYQYSVQKAAEIAKATKIVY